jgi:predicted AAA+ superfamily ATPase
MKVMTNTGKFLGSYRRRIVDDEVDYLLTELPALLLDGPKAVGKTETARQRAQTVVRLNRDREFQLVEAQLDEYLLKPTPVLFDEWQRLPQVWEAVKDSVDDDKTPGRYVLTGSAPVDDTHSGAGRIPSLRMRPLTLPERLVCTPSVSLKSLLSGQKPALSGAIDFSLEDYTDFILRSGFPGFQDLSSRSLNKQLDTYLERLVNVDMKEAGTVVRQPEALMRWLRAYAAAVATTTSWEKVRDGANAGHDDKPSRDTTTRYTEALTRLRILDEVPPWLPGDNHLSRLGQTPKRFLADPALAARLVGVPRDRLLQGDGPTVTPQDGTFLGALFESLVAMSLFVFSDANSVPLRHLRTWSGDHEVDFVVVGEGGKVVALEAKLGNTVRPEHVSHLHWLKEQLGDRLLDAVVVNTGSDAYRRKDGIGVVPLGLLGP